ncbi:cytochrome P450 1A1-like [Lissotriton helveticus]
MAVDLTYPEVMIALITFALVFKVLRNMKNEGKTPPGPWGLPVFGNIFQLGALPHITLSKMAKQYGDVFLISLGTVPVLVISGQETIKKVLVRQGDSFGARPKLHSISLLAESSILSFSPDFGETWKLHKKIAKNALRTFSKSEAKTSTCSCLLEEYVSAEAVELVTTLSELTERKGYFDPSGEIALAVANVVCALCFGKRYEHTDKEFTGVVQNNEEAQKAAASGAAADFIPLIRYLPLPGLRALTESVRRLQNFIKNRVDEHYKTCDEDCIRDITDALIGLCNKRQTKDNTITNHRIMSSVGDLFGAGFDTVSSALQWIFLYLFHCPEAQIKIHEEIDEQIGNTRLPRFEDRTKLHYTEAFISEVLRHSSFVPFTLPHCTTSDVNLNGYFISKDTCVFVNQYQVNHDPSLWKNPDSFLPERFLDKNGQLNRILQESVLTFGMGVRMCLGEDVARNEIFLMLTTVLQRLKLEPHPQEKLDLTPVNGLSMKPKTYQIKTVLRR